MLSCGNREGKQGKENMIKWRQDIVEARYRLVWSGAISRQTYTISRQTYAISRQTYSVVAPATYSLVAPPPMPAIWYFFFWLRCGSLGACLLEFSSWIKFYGVSLSWNMCLQTDKRLRFDSLRSDSPKNSLSQWFSNHCKKSSPLGWFSNQKKPVA